MIKERLIFEVLGISIEIWVANKPPRGYKRYDVPVFRENFCLCFRISTSWGHTLKRFCLV